MAIKMDLSAGDYEVSVSGMFFTSNGGVCSFAITDGTTTKSTSRSAVQAGANDQAPFSAVFNYSNSGTKTFSVQALRENGSGQASVYAGQTNGKIQLIVRLLQ